MQKYEVPQFFTCLEFAPNGDVITGDSSGGIIVWSKGNYPLSVPVNYEMWLGHFWSKFTEFSYFFFCFSVEEDQVYCEECTRGTGELVIVLL